jgi:hypothetical protein
MKERERERRPTGTPISQSHVLGTVETQQNVLMAAAAVESNKNVRITI